MPGIEDIHAEMRRANAAGDKEALRRAYVSLRAAEAQQEQTPDPTRRGANPQNLATGVKEFFMGGGEELAAAPELPMDAANSIANFGSRINPYGGEAWHPVPDFGIRKRFEEENPVTPGYETERWLGQRFLGPIGAGAVIGGTVGSPFGGIGALPGAVAGAGGGALVAGTSLLGRGLGTVIDSALGNKNGRWADILDFMGGAVPVGIKPLAASKTRKDFSGTNTPEAREAARRQGIEPSLSLLGGESAKRYAPKPNTFQNQLRGMEKLVNETEAGIRGSGTQIDPSRETMGREWRDLNAEARANAKDKISAEQQKLEDAVGGADVIHDPWSFVQGIRSKLADPKTERSKSDPQMRVILDDFAKNLQPRDVTRHEQLQALRDQVQEILGSGTPGDPALIKILSDGMTRIDDAIMDNLGVNENAIRQYFSGLKTRVKNASDPLYGMEVGKITDLGEDVRADTAVGRGALTREEWDSIQKATGQLYTESGAMDKAAKQPDTELNKAYNRGFGKDATVSPARTEYLRKNLPDQDAQNRINSVLAAEFMRKASRAGHVTTETLNNVARFIDELGPGAREQRAPTGTPARQNMEDVATLGREVKPYYGTDPTTSGGQNVLANMVRGAAVASGPAAALTGIIASPRGIKAALDVGKRAFGVNKETALARTNKQDLGRMIAEFVGMVGP